MQYDNCSSVNRQIFLNLYWSFHNFALAKKSFVFNFTLAKISVLETIFKLVETPISKAPLVSKDSILFDTFHMKLSICQEQSHHHDWGTVVDSEQIPKITISLVETLTAKTMKCPSIRLHSWEYFSTEIVTKVC